MAMMYPAAIIESARIGSEVKFFNACKKQLSDKFHVFYSVRWYTITNGVREDSECDFLVFNPDYGFICIEVKGGTGIEVNDREWRLLDRTGGRILKRSPYEQAEQSMRFFKKYYEDELETRFPGVYGCAVAFPNFQIHSPLTVESPLETTIDLRDMGNLQKRMIEIFQYFRSRRTGAASFLSSEAQRKFIGAVNKRIALSISAGALIEDKQAELVEINRTQDTVIDLLSHYPRAFIVGGAGTGKTWIGIKKIQRCIHRGNTALYLCFNRALSEFVRSLLPEAADCCNIDALAHRLLDGDIALAPEVNGEREYSALFAALPKLPQYDLVVVDEGQDFTEDWAFCANLLVKDAGSLYVFYDESQNIFNRTFGDRFLISEPPFVLRYNIRNTANIYRYAQEKTNLGLDTVTNRIEGVEPEFRRFTKKQQAVTFIDSIINKLVNREGVAQSKIVILSDRRKENSILAEAATVGGCVLDDTAITSTDDFIAYRTIQGFKGLESDVVVFIHHTCKNAPQTDGVRATLYAALTRARFYLYVINYEENM